MIFMTDQQRADVCRTEHPAKTPHLDAFSKESLTFAQTYCPTPHCCPSRATFFTGLYPTRHGVWNNLCNGQALSSGLKEGVRCWSEDLADAGYDLYFTGKWHVSVDADPKDYGWKEGDVTAKRGAHHGQTWEKYKQIAKEPLPTERGESQLIRKGYQNAKMYGVNPNWENHSDEQVTNDAVKAILERKDSEDPWCIYAGVIGPHDPFIVPQKYLDMYDPADMKLPESYHDDMEDKPRVYQRMRKQLFGQLTEAEVRESIRYYWAYCTWMDDLFGRLLNALQESGQAEDTLVLFCSDHGEYLGDHGLYCKGIPCFKEAYHVPAVIRFPGKVAQPGGVEEAFVSLADFGPTFLEAAGVQSEVDFTGVSLMPFVEGKQPDAWRDAVFTQCNGVEFYYTQRSVMTKQHKYVFNGFDFDELYDLEKDPHEMKNLAEDPTYEEVKEALCKKMWRFAYEQGDTATNSYYTVAMAPYGPAYAFK